MITKLLEITDKVVEIIQSPMKASFATVTGAVTGYVPMMITDITNIQRNCIDRGLQHAVWTLTILGSISALVSWIQKQRDRWKKNHPKKTNDSLYYIEEDNDED